MELSSESVDGRVVEVLGGHSRVIVPGRGEMRCLLTGTLRAAAGEEAIRNPVAVGDRVRVVPTAVSGEGMIEEVYERRTVLQKRASGERVQGQVVVANVDQLLIVVAIKKPRYKTGFIDRLLVAAQNGGLEARLVVNKLDLVKRNREEALAPLEIYRELGVPLHTTSAKHGEGIEELRDALKDRLSVLAGPSGVGKSSLLNVVQPGLELKTGNISPRWGKGRHITTRVTLLELDVGGFVADTPGVRAFGLWEVEPGDLWRAFPEFAPHVDGCHFSDCRHVAEPDCAVKAAVDAGEVPEVRYQSYTRMLEALAREG